MPTVNPFVDETVEASAWRPYQSDQARRAVWVKGKAAKVPSLGRSWCPVYQFSHVTFVSMNERRLTIDLSDRKFSTRDRLPVSVDVTLVAKVNDSERALLSIATSFDETLAVLQEDVAAAVGAFCRGRIADEILGTENQLSEDMAASLKNAPSAASFEVCSIVTRIGLEMLEREAERAASSSIGFENAKVTESRELELSAMRAARAMADVVADGHRALERFRVECEMKKALATSDAELRAAELEFAAKAGKLTDESATAMAHINPELWGRLELAKITHSMDARDAMEAKVVAYFGQLAKATQQWPNVINVMGSQTPPSTKSE